MTIDFGDGRVMRSTVGGNSAHYIVDVNGRPLDVVPANAQSSWQSYSILALPRLTVN